MVVLLGLEVGTGGYSDGVDLVAAVPKLSEDAYEEIFHFSVGYVASDKPISSLKRSGKPCPYSGIAHGRRLDCLVSTRRPLCIGIGLDRQGHEHACTSPFLTLTWSCSFSQILPLPALSRAHAYFFLVFTCVFLLLFFPLG